MFVTFLFSFVLYVACVCCFSGRMRKLPLCTWCVCYFSRRMRKLHQTAVHEVVRVSRQSTGRRCHRQQASAPARHLSASQCHQLLHQGRFMQNVMITWQTWSSRLMRLRQDHAIHYCCCPPLHDNSTHVSLIYQRTSLVQSTSQVTFCWYSLQCRGPAGHRKLG